MITKFFIIIFISIISIFNFNGCSDLSQPPREGFLLKKITQKRLPDLQKRAKKKKIILADAKKCFIKAQTINEANNCNDEVLKKDDEFEIDNFDKWDNKEKEYVINIINKNNSFLECIIASQNISQATSCKEPWHSVTGI